jgi:WD40 repeat protein
LKTSLCVQTFFGHNNAVNDVCFNLVGDKIASCDSDGIVKVWDVRMVKEKQQYDSGPYSANAVDFDASGTIIGIALNKG